MRLSQYIRGLKFAGDGLHDPQFLMEYETDELDMEVIHPHRPEEAIHMTYYALMTRIRMPRDIIVYLTLEPYNNFCEIHLDIYCLTRLKIKEYQKINDINITTENFEISLD